MQGQTLHTGLVVLAAFVLLRLRALFLSAELRTWRYKDEHERKDGYERTHDGPSDRC
jgi:hypothetical protein